MGANAWARRRFASRSARAILVETATVQLWELHSPLSQRQPIISGSLETWCPYSAAADSLTPTACRLHPQPDIFVGQAGRDTNPPPFPRPLSSSTMNNRVSKAQPRRSRVRLSKSLQAELLRAIGIPSPAPADLPPDDFPRDDLVSSTKRQLDEVNQPPSKKARLSNAHPPEDESRGAQLEKKARQHTLRFLWDQMLIAELGQTSALQFPKPKPLSYASFLNDFVDPIPPCSATDPEHSSILEWLGSLGSDRDTRCRSDSYLHPVNDSPPRHLTGSAPAMGYRRDSDGFRVPPTPSSTGLRSSVDAETRSVAATDATGSTPSSSRKSLVEDQCYRRRNLAANNISMRPLHDQFPEHVDDIVQLVQQDRDSPGPSLEDIKQDATLNQL